jgi:hypothetical protein
VGSGLCGGKERPMTDAKEVGVGDPAEEKTFCHRTGFGLATFNQDGKGFFSHFFERAHPERRASTKPLISRGF